MTFEDGKLPVKYLGVSLISCLLLFRDCKVLAERVKRRIDDWKNKSLSCAGKFIGLLCVYIAHSNHQGY